MRNLHQNSVSVPTVGTEDVAMDSPEQTWTHLLKIIKVAAVAWTL